mmetsp:Transcript_82649/g.145834  ORF Transcript_82649/g.145834 Transcript_82649/m.145834 type:complete len:229 (+) Transcript_82649:940-1626(+)
MELLKGCSVELQLFRSKLSFSLAEHCFYSIDGLLQPLWSSLRINPHRPQCRFGAGRRGHHRRSCGSLSSATSQCPKAAAFLEAFLLIYKTLLLGGELLLQIFDLLLLCLNLAFQVLVLTERKIEHSNLFFERLPLVWPALCVARQSIQILASRMHVGYFICMFSLHLGFPLVPGFSFGRKVGFISFMISELLVHLLTSLYRVQLLLPDLSILLLEISILLLEIHPQSF